MFIISITYTAHLNKIDQHLEDHIAYLDKQYAHGHFLLSGRKNPRTGGVILSSINNKAALDDILKQDPFYQHQLAHYDITDITPTKSCKKLAFLLEC